MAQRRLFDAHGGIVTTFEYDESNDSFALNDAQNAGPYLAQNARTRADSVPTGNFRMKGSIPFVLLRYLLKERGLTYYQFRRLGRGERDAIFYKILQDRDTYKLRTAEPTRKASYTGAGPALLLPGA